MFKYSFVFMDNTVRSLSGRLTYDDDNYILKDKDGFTYIIPRMHVRFYSFK